MLLLVSLFWNICLTREGPERVPDNQLLIGLIIIGKIVLVLLINAIRSAEPTAISVITAVVSWAALIGLMVALALLLRERLSRFWRTFGAILGTDLVLLCLYGTLLLVIHILSIDVDTNVMQTVGVLFQLWIIFVIGFILHRALDFNMGLSIAIAFFISVFSLTISYEVAKLT